MAVPYTNLFTFIKAALAAIRARQTQRSTGLPAEQTAILAQVGTDAGHSQTVIDTYSGFVSARAGEESSLAQAISDRVTSTDVVTQIPIAASDIGTVLAPLVRKMTADAQTVNRTVGSVGALVSRSIVGTGVVATTNLLDGNAPGVSYGAVVPASAGLASELYRPERFRWVCTADIPRDGAGADGESFGWLGVSTAGLTDSGRGPDLVARQTLTGGGLDTWTGGTTPDGWTATGTVANRTQVIVATDCFRGLGALRTAANGWTLTQSLAGASLRPRQMLCLSMYLYGEGAPGTPAFRLTLTGTGATFAAGNRLDVTAVTNGAWTLAYAFVLLPEIVPFDVGVELSCQTSPTNPVRIDEVRVQSVTYFGGIGAALIPGATAFLRGDEFEVVTSVSTQGDVQGFFRDYFGVQLPSAVSPTISD